MPTLLNLQGVADTLGVSRQRVYQLMEKPDFPEPEQVIGDRRAWSAEKIVKWQARRSVCPTCGSAL
jgi:predicted DNA-binding transcriptional regulator AlpA